MRQPNHSAAGLDPEILDLLVAYGEDGLDVDDRILAARTMCGRSHERAELTLRFVIDNLLASKRGLHQLRNKMSELEKVAQGLLEPPWYPAVFIRHVDRAGGRVLVWQGGTYRVVRLAEGVDRISLAGRGRSVPRQRDERRRRPLARAAAALR